MASDIMKTILSKMHRQNVFYEFSQIINTIKINSYKFTQSEKRCNLSVKIVKGHISSKEGVKQ